MCDADVDMEHHEIKSTSCIFLTMSRSHIQAKYTFLYQEMKGEQFSEHASSLERALLL